MSNGKIKLFMLFAMMGLLTATVGCSGFTAINPFPEDENDYRLVLQGRDVHVTFEANANPAPEISELNPRIESLNFFSSPETSRGAERYDTTCDYRSGDFLTGGEVECIVTLPPEQFPIEAEFKVEIWARAEITVTRSGRDETVVGSRSSPALDFHRASVDTDGDGIADTGEAGASPDNCPEDANPDQGDRDGDEVGDMCDDTPDGDAADPTDDTDAAVDPLPVTSGAFMAADAAGCGLVVGTAAINPALFILLGCALLPIVRLRRREHGYPHRILL